MFLKAGALSLLLLLASRLLGLARESAQAAAFGASGLADVAVLMLSLPDWLTGVVASGALAYVLVPAWAGRPGPAVAASQRRVARALVAGGLAIALAMALGREPLAAWLAGGLPGPLAPAAAQAMAWSAAAMPLALLAALWATRLQHERDFGGLYGANLVVNAVLIAAIAGAGWQLAQGHAITWLGLGLLAAMGLRLGWQAWRLRASASPFESAEPGATAPGESPDPSPQDPAPLPRAPVWAWAILSAGLPMALPFAARSIASLQGEGALATFNYAWKLVELPLVLAIQLVASLAFPSVAAAVARGLQADEARRPVRVAFSLAWALACAAAAGLLVGADAAARLLFGWGRMGPDALAQVAAWGRLAAWSLLPQALAAVGLTVLASQQRLRPAALLHAAALGLLVLASSVAPRDGLVLMALLDAVFALIALGVMASLGKGALACVPWRALAAPFAMLAGVDLATAAFGMPGAAQPLAGLALAVLAAGAVLAAAWPGEGGLRQALRR